jgi:hypothetical protein
VAVSPLDAGMPNAPFVDPLSGAITLVWRYFLLALYNRTGGSTGRSISDAATVAALNLERQGRQAGDASLLAQLDTEIARAEAAETALQQALAEEAALRAALSVNGLQGLADERNARMAADALLVPIAKLCSMWAQCDLRFLPSVDPGGGRPWLDNNVLTVGLPPTAIGVEAGTDQWIVEAGTDQWLWG